MKSLVKKILFCFAVIACLVTVAVFRTPLHIQTDLMSLVNTSGNAQQWATDRISNKFSSVIAPEKARPPNAKLPYLYFAPVVTEFETKAKTPFAPTRRPAVSFPVSQKLL